jgi:phosphatidylinositol 4-kinase
MIVRIIDNECTCFNTKKRVPYRIVVETIDYNELKTKNIITKRNPLAEV